MFHGVGIVELKILYQAIRNRMIILTSPIIRVLPFGQQTYMF